MFHYTWGTVFKDSFGRKIWEFDKRTYTDEIIQRQVSYTLTTKPISIVKLICHIGDSKMLQQCLTMLAMLKPC